MSKAERLFHLVNLLKGRRTAVTARDLAETLGVSERTVYRDIGALAAQGVPVSGDAGVGYLLAPHTHLPPLMFSPEEAIAISIGLKFVRAFTDPDLATAATTAEQRVKAVLPDGVKADLERLPYRIPVLQSGAEERDRHQRVRRAAAEYLKLRIDYRDEHGNPSVRVIWPLALVGWGDHWTILAWCETRVAYRNFRLDRIVGLVETGENFEATETINVAHYYRTEFGFEDI
ncbi:hypothetical protein VE25_10810 [Devosia geojensis]|uniref:DeoR faimly transcriptional regulator n=1 Tax=Devosia geojensis TaxID=443610 RepID=A0A0F5FS22_9HYPH|nr:YafY family protein [Devosia geojensis]KKB11669.1 hypothetical protein VE25_10810 [Devosia geojensis]